MPERILLRRHCPLSDVKSRALKLCGWKPKGYPPEGHVDTLLAKCSRMAIATAALDAAIAEYPGRLVTLSSYAAIDGTEVRERNQRK